MKLEFADPLVERAVELALAGREDETAYCQEREACYEIAEAEEREAAFRALHRRWFVTLDLERPYRQALAEVPALAGRASRVTVAPAARARGEGAELYVAPGDGAPLPAVVVRLLPTTAVDRRRLSWLLRRELLHVADMLDPAFGYQPRLPPSTAGPVHDDLLRRRYAALWSTSVAGRLARRGAAPSGMEEAARARLGGTFAGTGELFARLWAGERPTHSELVRLAASPLAAAEGGWKCGLCGFPTARREDVAELEAEVVSHLRRERPEWRPQEGLCPRCADLYRVRAGVFGRPSGARSESSPGQASG